MFRFHPPLISDKESVLQILSRFGFPGADLNFANLFLYQKKYAIEIRIENGILYRYYCGKQEDAGYAFPIGPVLPESFLPIKGIETASFRFLTEEQRNQLESFFPGKYRFAADRDSSDYLYRRDRLVSLEGRAFHRKRNALFRFRTEYPDFRFEPITLSNIDDALAVAEKWYNSRKENGILSPSLEEEREIIGNAVRWFSELGLTGGVLYVCGEPAAMSIVSQTYPGVYDVHFEKTVPDCPLANAAICTETARFLRDALYINREEDMGIPGLRAAKLAWFPEKIILRYTALPRS